MENKSIQPWYTKLSKTTSLMILVFVLVYAFTLRLSGGLTGSDVIFLLCALSMSALIGSL